MSKSKKFKNKHQVIKSTGSGLIDTSVKDKPVISEHPNYPVAGGFKPEPLPVKETKKEELPVPEPPVKRVFPKYDLFKAPVGMFDWTSAGVVFNELAVGKSDEKTKQSFYKLLDCGYEIAHFFIDSGIIYFVFKLNK